MSDDVLERLRSASSAVFVANDVMQPSVLEDAGRVHDWRNYVPNVIAELWEDLTERERRLVMLACETAADREEWD